MPTATAEPAASSVRICRGRAVSAADISVETPSTWASDGPNMIVAASSADPVVALTTIASVRLVIVEDALPNALPIHRLRNSRLAKICV